MSWRRRLGWVYRGLVALWAVMLVGDMTVGLEPWMRLVSFGVAFFAVSLAVGIIMATGRFP